MKLPLAYSLKNRASSLSEDAKLLNGYVESRGEGKKALTTVEKRPAIDSAFELTSGSGQALYVTNTPDGTDVLGTVIADILTRAPTAKTKRLRFGTQPSGVVLNTAFTVTVTIRDSLGNIVNSGANVTVALATNPTSATLGGTLTQAAVAGTATFNDLTLNRSGADFTLLATSSGLNSATSNAFTLATQLAFTTQPSNIAPNTDFTVAVTSRDSAGNTDTNFNGTVTLSLWSATGNGIPTGDFIVDAVNGVATFANISLSDGGVSGNADGTYSFVARADNQSFVNYYIPSYAVSNSFTVVDSTHTLVAVELVPGLEFGYASGIGGSITPTTYQSVTIGSFSTNHDESVLTRFTLQAEVSQDFFTSIQINGFTLLSASASYQVSGGTTIWDWTDDVLTQAGTFPISIS